MNHTVRTRDAKTKEIKNYTRGKAIKLFCTECLGWGESNPRDCTAPLCPLFPFRKGTQAAYHADSVEDVEEDETEAEND